MMIVAGWADGYRNNTFRTVARARDARVRRTGCSPDRGRTPTRPPRCPGRGSTSTSRWPAGSTTGCAARRHARGRLRRLRPHLDPARARPRPARGLLAAAAVGAADAGRRRSTLRRVRARCPSIADVGTAAWIDCAGHLPWGLSGDQRLDDARSLTWDVDAAGRSGRRAAASLRLRVSAAAPAASLSVKLCDVFPDGTSALVSRGTLDLAFRDGGARAPGAAGARRGVRRRGGPRRLRLRVVARTAAAASASRAPTGPTRSLRRPR